MQEYLNEIRHDAIEKQTSTIPQDEIQLLGRMMGFVVRFADVARKEGLLALESETNELNREEEEESLLYEGVSLIIDGTDPNRLLEILSNLYWINHPNGYHATAQYLIIRGLLAIQDSEHPILTKKILSSMLPSKIRTICQNHCDDFVTEKEEQEKKDRFEIAKKYFQTDFSISEDFFILSTVGKLEKKILCLNDGAIQRLLRDVDNSDVTYVLAAMTQEGREVLTRNMSSRLREMLIIDCYNFTKFTRTSQRETVCAEAANRIQQTLKNLQNSGEIVVPAQQ